jgi:hypothetical protein
MPDLTNEYYYLLLVHAVMTNGFVSTTRDYFRPFIEGIGCICILCFGRKEFERESNEEDEY